MTKRYHPYFKEYCRWCGILVRIGNNIHVDHSENSICIDCSHQDIL